MKKLSIAVLTLIVIALACWLIQANKKSPPLPAFVTLPDGSIARIISVTYGTNHVVGSQTARLVAHLPSFVQNLLRDLIGNRVVPMQTITTTTPELLVWLDQRTNGPLAASAGFCTAFLGDESNFISGAEASLITSTPISLIYPLHFNAFPHRDQKITLNIYEHDYKGVVHLRTNLSFANPLHQTYPQWQAETLPATKRTGDLEVTVQKFETGHDYNVSYQGDGFEYGTNITDGRNNTSVSLKFHPLTNVNESWQVCGAELTDATGNHIHNFGMSWNGNNASFAFNPSLWPSEAAWKIKLEVKKTAGFQPGETFVFRNVPLGELDHTNTIGWTTNIAGTSISLQAICRRAPITDGAWSSSQISGLHFTINGVATGTQLDMVQMVCNNGKTNHCDSWSSSGSERDYSFREIPLDAKTADITFAIQQSRTVEFTLKPELPKAKAGLKNK